MDANFKFKSVLLDANTIYGELTRDILLSLAEKRLFIPLWSEKILDEVAVNLQKNLDINFKNVRLKMNQVFPESCVTNFENLELDIIFPDQDDIHVLAAAKKSSADLIISEDKDFVPKNLIRYNLVAMKADQFLKIVLNFYGNIALRIFDNLRKRRSKIELLTESEFILRLNEIGLKETAKTLELMNYNLTN